MCDSKMDIKNKDLVSRLRKMNTRLVKFPDGNYAVRRGWVFYKYADLYANYLWWSCRDIHFADCLSKDYDKVLSVWGVVTGEVEIIL